MGRTYFRRKRRCPACSTLSGVPVHYGVPGPELYDAVEKGEIVVAEHPLRNGAQEWACRNCGNRWSEHHPAKE